MRRSALWKSSLGHVENVVFFAAMLLVVTLEGACVYWLGAGATGAPGGMASHNMLGPWTAATLPQCWLLGALLVLLYRLSAVLLPPRSWGKAETHANRQAFLRFWCWTAALGALQAGVLFLDRFALGVH
jgi:hypothetical protein